MVKEIHIINEINQLTCVNEELMQLADRLGLSEKMCMCLNLALEEAVSNVILYAYPGEKNKDIMIRFEIIDDVLKIVITDMGIPFDPNQREMPDITLPIHERPVGGLGIHLVKKIMTHVEYIREGNKNVLTMLKYIR